MEKLLLVDGHSFIFSSPTWRKEYLQNGRKVRQEVVRSLQCYHDAGNEKVVVVFDGKGHVHRAEQAEKNGILIMYSKGGATADSVLERLAGRYGAQDEVTIASNDRLVLDTCAAHGAIGISIKGLQERIDRATQNFRSDWKIQSSPE